MALSRPPPFEVEDANPSLSTTVAGFTKTDWSVFAGSTAASYGWGAYITRHRSNRTASGAVMALIGASFGFMYAYQNSFQRLTGFREPIKKDTRLPRILARHIE